MPASTPYKREHVVSLVLQRVIKILLVVSQLTFVVTPTLSSFVLLSLRTIAAASSGDSRLSFGRAFGAWFSPGGELVPLWVTI